MADGYFPLTSNQNEWAERAAVIADRELAPRAAEIDRTGTFPSEGLEILKREGFWKLRVSREHGGLEEDLLTTVLVTEILAKRCASTSLCYKMHLEASELVARVGTLDQIDRLVRPIVSGDALYTVAGSEVAGRGGAFAPSNAMSAVTPDGDGFRVENVRKSYVTSAGHATHHLFLCRIGKEATPDQVSGLIVERDKIDWKIVEPWNGFGMRGNNSSPVIFNGVVPRANLIGAEHTLMREQARKFLPVVTATYAAVYLGVAAGAFDEARKFLEYSDDETKPRIENPVTRHRMAELSIAIERSRALLYSAASAFDHGQPTSILACSQAKVACSETAVHVTSEIMGMGGGSAYARRLPFDRYLRDARAGVVMGITNDVVIGNVARMLFPPPKKASKGN
ncbi:MAG: acyl-CoA dehydrogenase family protein [Candidatus Binataceae bacterium]